MTSENSAVSRELEALLVDDSEQAIDGLLRNVLQPYVGFTREGRMVTKPQFLKLSDATRLLAALLARQAMIRLKLPGAKAEASAEELQNECMVPLKSARESLSRFKSRRLLDKNDAGYFVPTWAISDVAAAVQRNQQDK